MILLVISAAIFEAPWIVTSLNDKIGFRTNLSSCPSQGGMTFFQDVTDFGAKDFSYDHRRGIYVLYVPVMTISSVFISKWAQERNPSKPGLNRFWMSARIRKAPFSNWFKIGEDCSTLNTVNFISKNIVTLKSQGKSHSYLFLYIKKVFISWVKGHWTLHEKRERKEREARTPNPYTEKSVFAEEKRKFLGFFSLSRERKKKKQRP